MDAALTKSDTFETGGTTIHGRWSYGSGVIIGKGCQRRVERVDTGFCLGGGVEPMH